jgi:hypothetical protein
MIELADVEHQGACWRASASGESVRKARILQIYNRKVSYYMKDPVGQKYLLSTHPRHSGPSPDQWADIKQVLRTIKQLRKTIIVGVPRATLVICREITMKQSSDQRAQAGATGTAEVVTRKYYSSTYSRTVSITKPLVLYSTLLCGFWLAPRQFRK